MHKKAATANCSGHWKGLPKIDPLSFIHQRCFVGAADGILVSIVPLAIGTHYPVTAETVTGGGLQPRHFICHQLRQGQGFLFRHGQISIGGGDKFTHQPGRAHAEERNMVSFNANGINIVTFCKISPSLSSKGKTWVLSERRVVENPPC